MIPERREMKEEGSTIGLSFLLNPSKASQSHKATETNLGIGGEKSWKLQGRTGGEGAPQKNNLRSAEAPLSLWLNTKLHMFRMRFHKGS